MENQVIKAAPQIEKNKSSTSVNTCRPQEGGPLTADWDGAKEVVESRQGSLAEDDVRKRQIIVGR